MRSLGGVLIAIPFLFGALRFATTSGVDGRHLLVAFGACIGGGIFLVRRTPRSTRDRVRSPAD